MDESRREVKPLISVLIVTFNNEQHISSTLNELLTPVAVHDFEVLVWDNASSDQTIGKITTNEKFSGSLFASQINIGFARAVNELAKIARGEFLLLLNPDCVITYPDLAGLVDEIQILELSALGPLLINQRGRSHAGGGWNPSVPRVLSEVLRLPDLFGRMQKSGIYARRKAVEATPSPYPVDWIAGTCLLTRKQTFDELRGLTERWFMYCEDMDFGFRLGNSGLRSALTKSVTVGHIGGGSSSASAGISRLQSSTLVEHFHSTRPNSGFLRTLAFKGLVSLYSIENRCLLHWRRLVKREKAIQ